MKSLVMPLRRAIVALTVAVAMTACTTEVDLCTAEYHPHANKSSFTFTFPATVDVPDSMMVVANRIVARRISAVNVNTTTGYGRFVVGEVPVPADPVLDPSTDDSTTDTDTPADEETSGDPSADTDVPVDTDEPVVDEPAADTETGGNTGSSEDEPVADEPAADTENGGNTGSSEVIELGAKPYTMTRQAAGEEVSADQKNSFGLPVGTYRFLTFNMDTTEFVYDHVNSFLNGDAVIPMSELQLEYKVYYYGAPGLHSPVVSWQDYNPYAGYIQPDMRALCIDTMSVELATGQTTRVNFTPTPITQNIDLYFTIKKNFDSTHFTVDSVVAELGGIPRRVDLITGYLDPTRTAKMMFPMEFVNSQDEIIEDDMNARSVRCHANLNVTGVVAPSSDEAATGPGILQVIIWAHMEGSKGEIVNRRLQGKINLYNTLNRVKPTVYTEDNQRVVKSADYVRIVIGADLTIDGKTLLETTDRDFGIDTWTPIDDIEVDI